MSWHVKVPVEGSRHLDIVDDEGRTIAHVHRRTGMEPGEYRANAELLASAPKLRSDLDYHKGLEEAALQTRGEIEWLGVKYEKAVAALRLVMEWWAAHEFDAIPLGDGDERNAYDDEPAMVKAAREALK